MIKSNLILLLFCAIILQSCTSKEPSNANYQIVPLPQEIRDITGVPFVLNRSTRIVIDNNIQDLRSNADFLSTYMNETVGYELEFTDKVTKNTIILDTNYVSENKEAYQLTINENNIKISGASTAGLFYGIQTFRKSIPANNKGEVTFAQIQITDYPAYPHRGAMLDVSRHFSSAEFVKKYIDILALNNMNVFHWHLTDDQGWRIEIKKYPRLTEIGAYRDSTIIGRHSDKYDKTRHGGFYTQEQIKEIIEYARQRHITIIPEIDLPGHMLAALASYPQLGCTGGPYQTATGWGIFEDVLCVGNEESFTFIKDVLDEVSVLFPSEYIHIGGDECLKNKWLACPKCQAKIKELNLRPSKAAHVGEQLQSYFFSRVAKILSDNNKKLIGWDEIIEGGITANATIMSWRGINGGIYAADRGHNVIMTPEAFVYLDYYQSANDTKEPYTFGWLTDLKKVYSFDPMPSELDEDKKQHILGAQVNVWTEYMPTSNNIEYMLLPRISALAETVWSNPKNKNYDEFVTRLHRLSQHYDKLGYKNSKQAFGIQDLLVVDTTKSEIRLFLSTFDNRAISYSINDDTDYNNKEGEQIITIKDSTTITVHNEDNYQKNFAFNKATAKPITLKNKPYSRYTFRGAETLIDGQHGSLVTYRTGSWIGFLDDNCEALIDLKEMTDINLVSFSCFINTQGSLFPPKGFKVYISADNKYFEPFYSKEYDEPKSHILPSVRKYESGLNEPQKARYVKIVIQSVGTVPQWHERKGAAGYLMVDEITIL